jgi:histidine triad (HIT) family protein
VPALCYNLREAPLSHERNPEYAAKLQTALRRLDFPADYVASVAESAGGSGPSTSAPIYRGDDFYCDEALSGRTPVEVVAETATVLAFRHTRPFWPVHIVVVPKAHVPSLLDLGAPGEPLLLEVLAVVRRLAAQVTREHGACRVLTNLGRYQDSKHLHFHLSAGDPLR